MKSTLMLYRASLFVDSDGSRIKTSSCLEAKRAFAVPRSISKRHCGIKVLKETCLNIIFARFRGIQGLVGNRSLVALLMANTLHQASVFV